MTALKIVDLTKRYGKHVAVNGVSLAVEKGEFLSLLGPSGCGKTTILRMVAGLVEPDAGQIFIGGQDKTWMSPSKRDIGLVFQSYALFPHMSVFENVAFGLRQRGVDLAAIEQRVHEALDLVRLHGLDQRFPAELSGGQQQRVALARAIAPRPSLLLLDEPLSNLDAKLRETMRIELRLLQRQLGISTVFVTHDQEEALTMSDRICVVNAGCIEQIGSPREVYDQPATSFVAEFFGRANFLDGVVGVQQSPYAVELDGAPPIAVDSLPEDASVGDPVRLTLRRESLRMHLQQPEGASNCFRGQVSLSSFAGNTTVHLIKLDSGLEMSIESQMTRGSAPVPVDTPVWLTVDPASVIVMRR